MKIGGNGSKPSYLSYFNLFHLVSTGFYWFLQYLQFSDGNLWNCSPMNRWGPSDLQQRASQAAALLQPRVSELTGAGGVLLGFLLWCKVEAGSKMMTLASTRQMFWMFGYVMLCVYIKQDESSFRPEKYCAKLRFSHGFSTFQWNPLDS